VDERDFDRWLAARGPGATVAYHLGPSLALDRLGDPVLDLLARAVMLRSRGTTLGFTPPPCGHLRCIWHGSGDVEARQRRLPGGLWLYTATRL
jgi:hypothetical protein